MYSSQIQFLNKLRSVDSIYYESLKHDKYLSSENLH